MTTDHMRHDGGRAAFWLRLESAAVALAAFYLYSRTGTSWWLFALLFLAPDLFMVGYLRGPQLGARVYNLGHVYAAPLLLAAIGWSAGVPYAVPVALIWTAHIAADRALGYGLKLPTGFRQTHLGAIGGGETNRVAGSLDGRYGDPDRYVDEERASWRED